MATDPGAPKPDIDRPDVAPAEQPPIRHEPSQPGAPDAPAEEPLEALAYDTPDQAPTEMPSTI